MDKCTLQLVGQKTVFNVVFTIQYFHIAKAAVTLMDAIHW